MKLASAAQMRELDRQAIEERHIPSIDLMDRAAEGVAQAVLRLLPGRPGKHCRVAVFCGAGASGCARRFWRAAMTRSCASICSRR